MMNHYTEIYESKSTLPLIALPFQNISKVKVSAETVEKPRGVLSVKKTAFENTSGSTFSNRAL
jgi:hypothetical protein